MTRGSRGRYPHFWCKGPEGQRRFVNPFDKGPLGVRPRAPPLAPRAPSLASAAAWLLRVNR